MSALLSYWKVRKSSLNFLMRTPKRKFGQSKYHRLRVELKKLKAILSMTKFQQKEFDLKKFYKPFRQLFFQAGKVRELQIEKEILKNYGQSEAIPSLLKSIDKKIGIEKKAFFKVRSLKLSSKIQKRLKRLKPRIQNLKKSDFSTYLNCKLEEIKLILASGKLEEANGHLLRKKLKTLKYNLESLQRSGVSVSPPGLDELLGILGSWHDLTIVNEALKLDLSSDRLSPAEIISIQQIRQKIGTLTAELIQEINLKAILLDDFKLPSKLKI